MRKNYLEIPRVGDVVKTKSFNEISNPILNIRELEYLKSFILKLNNNSSILEIGSFVGRSAVAMAESAEQNNSNIICVDSFKHGNSWFPKQKELFYENVQGWNNITIVESTSSDFFKNNPSLKFDMIYIDGDHSIRGFVSDLVNSIKSVKSFLTGHDFCMLSPWIIDVIQEISLKFEVNYNVVGWTWHLEISPQLREKAENDLEEYLLTWLKTRSDYYHFINPFYKTHNLNFI